MKTHGFIKAGNSVIDSLYSGTVAGFVCVVVDDRQGIQSDSIVDTEAFVKGIGIPHKVADVENVYRDVLEGFELSERLGLPFALIIDASDLDRTSTISSDGTLGTAPFQYRRDIAQHVLCPPSVDTRGKFCAAKKMGATGRAFSGPPSCPFLNRCPKDGGR